MLSRIPAVKWAFNRLRPAPHNGSIDVAPSAAEEQGAVTVIAGAVPTAETIASEDSSLRTLTEIAPAVVEEISLPSVDVASEPVDAPGLISCDMPAELLANVEPDVVEGALASSAEVKAIEPLKPVISSDASSGDDAEVAPDVAEHAPISTVEVETAPVEAREPVMEDEPASAASREIEAFALEETPDVVIDTDIASVAAEIAEDTIADGVVAAQVEPPPAPAPKKLRAKVVEPADRAALIRQRWAETGIRMWNPRLHGTGDATLNIQGRIGLLPPEPGETMPRYDKLEFEMLGGQIVCEGVIVEAPVHAGQRSFTRLAEPRSADRAREQMRERQAALA